ncbi:hypothetical protein ACGC1H_006516 [Rhizoctonia solani]
MPSIIVPYTAPPSPSSPESRHLTSLASLSASHSITPSIHMPPLQSIHGTPTRSIHIVLSSFLNRNTSIRSTMTVETDVSYQSSVLESSPSFTPLDLPEEAEYEPTWSGLEDMLSIASGTTASCGYNVIRQYPPTLSLPTAESLPTVESMESDAIDNKSLQSVSGELGLRPVTPLRIAPSEAESSISSETTITLLCSPKPCPSRLPFEQPLRRASPCPLPRETSLPLKHSRREQSRFFSDGDLNKGTVPPSHIDSHDVNRLLQYLHKVNTVREGET